ncbi:MAG: hypothetical protein K0U93_01495 [Gammaproteobacteria bacterium]|nr:hypothetical protein [Gammaproteobacteria bacterium]
MKSWNQKLDGFKPSKVKICPMDIAGMKSGQRMLVPDGGDVADFIRQIPVGESMDVKTLRTELAKHHGAEVTCPITMGFILRALAEVTFEQLNSSADTGPLTPVWRVIDESTPTFKKLRDPQFIRDMRHRESLSDDTVSIR